MPRLSSLTCLSGGIAGIASCLLLGFQSNLTLGYFRSLQPRWLPEQGVAYVQPLGAPPRLRPLGPSRRSWRLAFGQPFLTGGADSLPRCTATLAWMTPACSIRRMRCCTAGADRLMASPITRCGIELSRWRMFRVATSKLSRVIDDEDLDTENPFERKSLALSGYK
jgi:hypothetical protein